MHICLIEDDRDICEMLTFNLEVDGHSVARQHDGLLACETVRRERPDFVLLDLGLPGLDGFEICRTLKNDPETRHIPIIILTVRNRESEELLGLGLGADDYLTKPFKVSVLLARIRAVQRRVQAPAATTPGRIELDWLAIDPQRHEVRVDGRALQFTATEFRLLYLLASNPGIVYTREVLLSVAVGTDVIVSDHNIDVRVSSIRHKLGIRWPHIDTVRCVGYRFITQTEQAGA